MVALTTERQDGVSTRYYAATDQVGSVTKVLDGSGRVVWESEYTPYGNVAGVQGSIRFPGMYAGKDLDVETGLTYHWNRWRSEDGAYFISEDPLRDGVNYYGYANASPMCFTDPTGLEAFSFKCKDGTYMLSVDDSTVEAAGESLLGFIPIPFFDSFMINSIHSHHGFTKIDEEDAKTKLRQNISTILEPISPLGKVNFNGKAGKWVKTIGKGASYLGDALTLIDVIVNLTKVEDVAIDLLVSKYFWLFLQGNTHDELAMLYVYAKSQMKDMLKSGEIRMKTDLSGKLIEWEVSPRVFLIMDDLVQMKRLIREIDPTAFSQKIIDDDAWWDADEDSPAWLQEYNRINWTIVMSPLRVPVVTSQETGSSPSVIEENDDGNDDPFVTINR